jgi:DNA gyrase subunit A
VPVGSRDSKGQHIANLLELPPEESITKVLDFKNFDDAQYLVFATKRGIIKKTKLEYFSRINSRGIRALNFRENEDGLKDELVNVCLANSDDTLIMVSKNGNFVRIELHDEKIRALSRTAMGIKGIRFREGDELLAADIVPAENEGFDVVTVTEEGFAKRTPVADYAVKGRGGLGSRVAKVTEKKGNLLSALVTSEDDELLAIMQSGKVVRVKVNEIRETSRNSQGVIFAKSDDGDEILRIAKNVERDLPETDETRQGEENG